MSAIERARRLRDKRPVAAPGATSVRAENAHTDVPHGFAASSRPVFAAPTDPEDPQRVLECARHYTEIDPAHWPARYFSPRELSGRTDGLVYVRPEALAALERLRELQGRPVIVTSAYRSAGATGHNQAVNGARRSKHTLGHAFDIRADQFHTLGEIREFRRNARAAGFTAVVDYPDNNFIHIDMRTSGALAWSSGGASLGTTADPGAGGEAWGRALADEDGRVAKSTEKTVGNAAITATATVGATAASALSPADAEGLLGVVLKLLPYGPAAVIAIFGGYLALKYGSWACFRVSEWLRRFRGS